MANDAADGPAIPARPLVITPTDEWLARISDQLEELNSHHRPVAPAPAKKAPGTRKRAEVRGN